jgi:DNA-binding winged helix-turn-helix (wHTH) protein
VARPQPQPNPVQLRFVEFEHDEANACLSRNGEAVALAPTPFTLLCVLARQPGSLVTKEALLDAVWGHRFVSDSVLKTAISDLRKVLGDDPRQPRYIETVSRRGYRFIAAPSPAPSMPPASATVPAAGAHPSPPFIGRTDEISRLQLPWLSTTAERDALRRELAGVGPDRMLREMGELLDRYTEQRPLLLVTEDLHWSDRATVQLINYVARRRGHTRLMWLSSFRLAEVVALDHPLSSLRHELRLQRLCEELVLDPFSETEVADYVALSSASLARDEAFVRALHERTDGVPLFVMD